MIAVDSNLLVYAHRRDSPWHDAASNCLNSLAEGRNAWAIPWPCVHEFLAVVTHPRLYKPATSLEKALNQVDAWATAPRVHFLAETDMHLSCLRALLSSGQICGPQIHDARIAALCVEHGIDELWSADRDFGRFPQLSVRNPLIR
jgi:toxin-antitoxin system PIN domain toxin